MTKERPNTAVKTPAPALSLPVICNGATLVAVVLEIGRAHV